LSIYGKNRNKFLILFFLSVENSSSFGFFEGGMRVGKKPNVLECAWGFTLMPNAAITIIQFKIF